MLEVDLSRGIRMKVKNLGDRALFLVHNASFSCERNNNGCCVKLNSIYFANDCIEVYYDTKGGDKDMGIYNLQDGDGSFSPYLVGRSYSRITPPLWIAP